MIEQKVKIQVNVWSDCPVNVLRVPILLVNVETSQLEALSAEILIFQKFLEWQMGNLSLRRGPVGGSASLGTLTCRISWHNFYSNSFLSNKFNK